MPKSIDQLLGGLVEILVPRLLEPGPIQFKHVDEVGVSAVRRICDKRTGAIQRLRVPLNRNAFLCGCLDYTEHEPIEHLIVGLGYAHGSTTKVHSIGHVMGRRDSVDVPQWVDAAIERHLRTGARAEAILFHNHPRWWANSALDNLPLPSVQDRHALVARAFRPVYVLRRFLGNGGFRFYLGENGYVREFTAPPLHMMLKWMRRLDEGRHT